MRARPTITQTTADIIVQLRALVPGRALSVVEEVSLAERQAYRLLVLSHIDQPPVPQFVISSLPGITVDRPQEWPTSGMSTKTGYGWRIVLAGDDALSRQRFSLAHEFKHVLDDPVIDRLHRHLPQSARHDRREYICNHFAACLLMPRRWIKRDWGNGIQGLDALRRRYAVSSQAMAIRLAELGLHTPIERIK